MTISITLPYPPSANVYWRNYRGRTVVSSEAKDYKETVGQLCNIAQLDPLEGDIGIRLTVYRPRKSGDLSNRIKVLEDALQGYAYKDDKQIVEIVASRRDDKKNPRVEVEIWEIAA